MLPVAELGSIGMALYFVCFIVQRQPGLLCTSRHGYRYSEDIETIRLLHVAQARLFLFDSRSIHSQCCWEWPSE
jgi:hypothetical protein